MSAGHTSELKVLALWAAFASYGSFAAGAFLFFVGRARATTGFRVLKVMALAAAAVELWALWRAPVTSTWPWVLGLGLYAAALVLFFSCVAVNRRKPLSLAFTPDLPEHLVSAGPYGVVRHPYYSSYLLSYVAGLVATGNPILVLVVGSMAVLYGTAARAEEANFRSSSLSDAYDRYRRRTGMFFPRWGRAGVGRTGDSLP